MTNALGIAAATAVLRALLRNAVTDTSLVQPALTGLLGTVHVTAQPLDKVAPAAGSSQLNLFLYRIAPNTGWANAELPARSRDGVRVANPPLALDLHYLLTAHGEKELFAEMLLGMGALVVHRFGTLRRSDVRATFTPSGGGQLPAELDTLATAGLEDQEEVMRLSLDPIDSDELSRLWQMCGEKCRPGIAVTASVVLLRAPEQPAAGGPPVRTVESVTSASIAPRIGTVAPAQVHPGDTLTLTGTSLTGGRAVFGSGESDDVAAGGQPLSVTVTVPGLPAGVATVRVVQQAVFTGGMRDGPTSNAAAFLVRPSLTAVTTESVTGPALARRAAVTATLHPQVTGRQPVVLLLNERAAPAGRAPHRFTFDADPRGEDPTDTVTFTVTGVPAAEYLARVGVSGAETELTVTGGTYSGPVVDLT